MIMIERLFGRWGAALPAAVLLAALVTACGGGGGVGSGGTGAPLARSTGTGTVTGFGSLFLDGVRYDDSGARIVAEVSPGVIVNAPLALGHSVEVDIEGTDRLALVAVEARLVARIEAIGPGASFRALRQTVTLNGDPDAGPVTLFAAPLADGGSLRVGDVVEVHGVLRAGSAGDELQATRIERRTAEPEQWRVVGRVEGLGSGPAAGFSIGGLSIDRSAATLVPEGATLAEGQSVLVFGNSVAGDATRLRATQVRIYQRVSAPDVPAQLGGVVDALAGSRFVVNGERVELAGDAQIVPASRTLANGAYVQLRGSYRDSDGVLVATRVQIRNSADASTAVELAGNAVEVDPGAGTLRVRGTLVFTAQARLQSCPGGVVEGGYVEVSGTLGPSGVIADTVRCRNEPSGARLERRGVAGPLSPTTSSFELATNGNATVTVRVDENTLLQGLTTATLPGARVRVVGTFRAGVMQAQIIERL